MRDTHTCVCACVYWPDVGVRSLPHPSPLCLQAESLPVATLAGQLSLCDLEMHASLTFFTCSGV